MLHYEMNMQMKHARKDRGLTQTDLAEAVGVEQATISRMEKLDAGTTLKHYMRVADVLGVSLSELFSEDRDELELRILRAFREMNKDQQHLWVQMAEAVAEDRA